MFLAKDARSDWFRYLTIEATLRKSFGAVLNYDYNADHHDHFVHGPDWLGLTHTATAAA